MARRPVARGGMFSTPKVTFSKDTEQLLKGQIACVIDQHDQLVIMHQHSAVHSSKTVTYLWYILAAMMKESHLTNFQQRKLAEKLKSENCPLLT